VRGVGAAGRAARIPATRAPFVATGDVDRTCSQKRAIDSGRWPAHGADGPLIAPRHIEATAQDRPARSFLVRNPRDARPEGVGGCTLSFAESRRSSSRSPCWHRY
jgi:hypothetical protein